MALATLLVAVWLAAVSGDEHSSRRRRRRAFPPLPPAPSGPSGGPEQLHLALGEDPSAVTVTFVSAKSHPTAKCSVAHGSSRSPFASFSGTSTDYSDGGWVGLIHLVHFSGLSADTKYSYTCDDTAWHSFQTAPAVGTLPVTIAAIADLGEDCSEEGCGNATIQAMAADSSYSILVHAGDIAYTSGTQSIWDNFLREMEPIAANRPYMVCVGNHEHYYNFSGYRNRFNMPGEARNNQNLWYSFDHGGVHFVAFSTEHDLDLQTEWLAADLKAAAANRAKVPWVVVFAHRPLYCSTEDLMDCGDRSWSGNVKIRAAVEPLFEQYKVDLFLGGHLHNYERTWPVMGNRTVAKSYADPEAPVHIVVGMAGDNEGLTDNWETCPDWTVKRSATLGYTRLRFDSPTSMTFEFVHSDDGTVGDTFTITRSAAPSSLPEQLVV